MAQKDMMWLRLYNYRRLEDSIKVMRLAVKKSITNPHTRQLAMQIIGSCQARDDLCEVTSIFNWLKRNFRYTSDIRTIDTFQTLERTLEFGGGDCDDGAIALCALLESVGFETGFRVVKTQGAKSWNHVYAYVRIPKRMPKAPMPLDLTLYNPKAGDQPPASIIVDFKDFEAVVD